MTYRRRFGRNGPRNHPAGGVGAFAVSKPSGAKAEPGVWGRIRRGLGGLVRRASICLALGLAFGSAHAQGLGSGIGSPTGILYPYWTIWSLSQAPMRLSGTNHAQVRLADYLKHDMFVVLAPVRCPACLLSLQHALTAYHPEKYNAEEDHILFLVVSDDLTVRPTYCDPLPARVECGVISGRFHAQGDPTLDDLIPSAGAFAAVFPGGAVVSIEPLPADHPDIEAAENAVLKGASDGDKLWAHLIRPLAPALSPASSIDLVDLYWDKVENWNRLPATAAVAPKVIHADAEIMGRLFEQARKSGVESREYSAPITLRGGKAVLGAFAPGEAMSANELCQSACSVDFHSHPFKSFFSTSDVRSAFRFRHASVMTDPSGDGYLLLPSKEYPPPHPGVLEGDPYRVDILYSSALIADVDCEIGKPPAYRVCLDDSAYNLAYELGISVYKWDGAQFVKIEPSTFQTNILFAFAGGPPLKHPWMTPYLIGLFWNAAHDDVFRAPKPVSTEQLSAEIDSTLAKHIDKESDRQRKWELTEQRVFFAGKSRREWLIYMAHQARVVNPEFFSDNGPYVTGVQAADFVSTGKDDSIIYHWGLVDRAKFFHWDTLGSATIFDTGEAEVKTAPNIVDIKRILSESKGEAIQGYDQNLDELWLLAPLNADRTQFSVRTEPVNRLAGDGHPMNSYRFTYSRDCRARQVRIDKAETFEQSDMGGAMTGGDAASGGRTRTAADADLLPWEKKLLDAC